ncbi:MAG: ribulose-phosphate 3-epimerase [Candidatus Diapherotrites archaeon]|uniref:Ribulose-phosphate 3-epimerase n=1 Tax=Candidatus Iainarchaeum sp. TaxID=3101447 RepID=A0A2D6LQD7_9ARCH|nr:ribulose-phosphate 3-epimerase [Candidatus Diapherotrites archaeon]|tara:strand:+ start:1149 stop:1799 length:651 start_codon:yes stop_codon:yes gene_type:complete
MVKIAASVLNADFSKWQEWLPKLEEAKVDRIQWDIMDNKYVPNNGVDKKWLAELRNHTKIFFESHHMVKKPEEQVTEFAEMGSNMFIFHIETTSEPLKLIEKIEEHGMKVGIAVNNQTPVEKIFPYLDKVDLALVMTVEAGFGGQSFVEKNLEKVKALRKKIDSEKLDCKIEVDGGIDAKTGALCVASGVDVLVSGSGIFKHPKGIAEAVKELHKS